MLSRAKQLVLAALAGVGIWVPAVQAQPSNNFRVPPAAQNQAAFNAGATLGSAAGAQAGFQVGAMNTPYYASSLYGPVQTPANGYLTGAASVIGAQSQFMLSTEQAKLTREDVNRSRMDTRRKSIEQWMWERNTLPTLEDDRERDRMQQLRRSRNDPPATEIWSAKALNDLFSNIQRAQATGVPGPTVPLDSQTLSLINVTTGATAGSLGLLRDGGKLTWPFVLRKSTYEVGRKKLDQLAPQAFMQVQANDLSPDTLQAMTDAVKSLDDQLDQDVSTLTPNDFIKGKRYLNEMKGSLKTIQDPNAVHYATRKWAAKGNTVAELVADMSRQGLKFAAATQGDEAAYTALYRALVTYDVNLGGPSMRTMATGPGGAMP